MLRILSKRAGVTTGALLGLILASSLYAGTPIVVKIKTQPVTMIAPGFSGVNTPQPRNGVEYYDPNFLKAVIPLKAKTVRYPGGTVSLDFDWTTGHTNIDWMNSLIAGDPPLVSGQSASILTISQLLTQAKGGALFSDFANFASTLGAAVVLCFNSYTDTNSGSAAEMALTAQSYGLNVLEWELGNEAYLYPTIYPTATSYSTASNSYFNQISTVYPTASVGLFPAGWYPGSTGCGATAAPPLPCFPTWDQQLWQTSTPYWNAASNHIYPVTGSMTAQNTIFMLNGILAHGSSDYIASYLTPLVGASTPIFITEMNCCSSYNNKFLTYIYNGIFLAEYTARLSAVPNVKGVLINSLYTDNSDYHGLIQSVDDYETYLIAQVTANPLWSTNTATNPNTPFAFYTSAPGLAMEVANEAINSGTRIFSTTVTGGPTVQITGFDGNPIPAIFAQDYLGTNGHHYLLIINKSAAQQTVTIEINGTPITNNLSVRSVGNSSALANNTATAQTNVQIVAASATNPVQVPPYSVNTITW